MIGLATSGVAVKEQGMAEVALTGPLPATAFVLVGGPE